MNIWTRVYRFFVDREWRTFVAAASAALVAAGSQLEIVSDAVEAVGPTPTVASVAAAAALLTGANASSRSTVAAAQYESSEEGYKNGYSDGYSDGSTVA